MFAPARWRAAPALLDVAVLAIHEYHNQQRRVQRCEPPCSTRGSCVQFQCMEIARCVYEGRRISIVEH